MQKRPHQRRKRHAASRRSRTESLCSGRRRTLRALSAYIPLSHKDSCFSLCRHGNTFLLQCAFLKWKHWKRSCPVKSILETLHCVTGCGVLRLELQLVVHLRASRGCKSGLANTAEKTNAFPVEAQGSDGPGVTQSGQCRAWEPLAPTRSFRVRVPSRRGSHRAASRARQRRPPIIMARRDVARCLSVLYLFNFMSGSPSRAVPRWRVSRTCAPRAASPRPLA